MRPLRVGIKEVDTMKYPNLTEVFRWHPYSDATFADHAGITTRLFREVISGDEELTPMELWGISRLIKMPANALNCPKLIMLDKDNYKHKNMVNAITEAIKQINEYSAKGSRRVKEYIDIHQCDILCEDFLKDFFKNKATYSRYIGIKEHINCVFVHIRYENSKHKRRDLSTDRGGKTI